MTGSPTAKAIQPTSDNGYFLADHLGSTNGLANTSGTVTATNSYDSFGNATNSSFPTRYQYTGRENDSFTGLQYNRARWYDPNLGRFITEDPIGFRGRDVNLYGYALNNPNRWRDPLGTDILGVAFGGSGGVGPGDGIAGSASTIYGISGPLYSSNSEVDAGTASSVGLYTGDSSNCPKGQVVAFGGSLSFSLVASNARTFHDLTGGFDSHFFGAGPLSAEVDIGSANDGFPVVVFQIGGSPSVLSTGKFGYAKYNTYTPPESVGTVRGLGSNLAGNISDLYGAGYRNCSCGR